MKSEMHSVIANPVSNSISASSKGNDRWLAGRETGWLSG
jgi:hypothetical protein